jgi:hypothetical protein
VIRWGALAAIVGGTLFIVSAVLTNFSLLSGPARYAADVPAYAAFLLGGAGLYAGQSDRLGVVGAAGFCLLFAGFAVAGLSGAIIAGVAWTSGPQTVPGWLGLTTTLGVLFVVCGSVLFGVATLRARVLPRGGSLLLIAGPLLLVVMMLGGVRDPRLFVLPSALFGAGWIWLGYELPVAVRRKRRRRPKPAP